MASSFSQVTLQAQQQQARHYYLLPRLQPPLRIRGSICAANLQADHYRVLGVAPGSSKQEIKRAYRSLARKYHPDVCKADHCVPMFKKINAAYEGLSGAASICCGASDYEWDDEEEGEEWNGGWEGAWWVR